MKDPTRAATHAMGRAHVSERLSLISREIDVCAMSPRGKGYDFLLGGKIRVAIKATILRPYARDVKVRGKKYRYTYDMGWVSFHRHGILERYADYVVCLFFRGKSVEREYVIPWEEVSGKTFGLYGNTYEGKYAKFSRCWAPVFAEAKKYQKSSNVHLQPNRLGVMGSAGKGNT